MVPARLFPAVLFRPLFPERLTFINAQMLLSYQAWDTKLSESQCQKFSMANKNDGTHKKLASRTKGAERTMHVILAWNLIIHPYLRTTFLEGDFFVFLSTLFNTASSVVP
jgi:hypothetical protein